MELPLNSDEQAWLEEYRQELRRRYPGVVADLRVLDGRDDKLPDARPALNLAVVLKGSSDRDQSFIDLSDLGGRLAKSAAVNPVIRVYTAAEWQLRRHNSLSGGEGGKSVWERDVLADLPGPECSLPPWARPDSWELRLSPDEKEWLADYRQALREQYPGLVKDLRVFARHDCVGHTTWGALNLVVTLKGGGKERPLSDGVKELGYAASRWNPTFPAIAIYTEDEWQQGQQDDTLPYYGSGVSVWLK